MDYPDKDFYNQRPALYEQGDALLWDDTHISKAVLEAHLDPKTDAASRRPDFMGQSVQWLTNIAGPPKGKTLLDLGCGPGLYAEPLHEAGFSVTGMDISKRSIQYALYQAALKDYSIHYTVQNYLSMEYTAQFDAVILLYCGLGVHTPQQRAQLMHKIHKALRPGGLFVFDVYTPFYFSTFKEDRTNVKFSHGGFWSPQPHMCVHQRFAYPNNTYLERYSITTGQETKQFHLWEHGFTKEELAALAEDTGFTASFYGNAAGIPYEVSGKEMCAVFYKA